MDLQARKDRLHQYLDSVVDEGKMDNIERFIESMFSGAEGTLTDEQWGEVERRDTLLQSGKMKSSSWNDVESRLRTKHGI
jgi:hypothetical protein